MRSLLCVLALAAAASAQTFGPSVSNSIHDAPRDGLGDSFNAPTFPGLLRQTSTQEDRAVQEFDLTALAGATLQSATLSGTVSVNNAFDNGPRTFDFALYAGNGTVDLSDFQVAAIIVGGGSYHPPTQTSFTYSFDVTSTVQSLLNGGANFVGLKVDCSSEPNFPNLLDPVTSQLVVVVASCAPPVSYCTGGVTSNACVAAISGTGTPSASAGSGFTISVANVEGGQQGILFYGADNSGFTPLAWGPSTSFMCVKSPVERMAPQSAGGTAGQCDGVLSVDWNAFIATHPFAVGQPFAAGQHVYAQGWFRDPPSPKTTMLSNGVHFVVCP